MALAPARHASDTADRSDLRMLFARNHTHRTLSGSQTESVAGCPAQAGDCCKNRLKTVIAREAHDTRVMIALPSLRLTQHA